MITQIESGELPPGSRLAPERELSLEFNINRMTLRRALGVLEAQGLVERQHGIGNFVSHSRINRQMDSIFRFTSGMEKRGFSPGTKLVSIQIIKPEQKLALDLGIDRSSQVYDILRLRSINQEPIMLESYRIPLERFPELHKFNLQSRSIYEIFESEYGVKIARSRQSLEPIIATSHEAKMLKITPGDPLMLEERLSFDADGQPIEFGKDRYRGDRFRFIAEISPKTV